MQIGRAREGGGGVSLLPGVFPGFSVRQFPPRFLDYGQPCWNFPTDAPLLTALFCVESQCLGRVLDGESRRGKEAGDKKQPRFFLTVKTKFEKATRR